MADNYLGKKMEDYARGVTSPRKHTPQLGRLLQKNRSHRAYDTSFRVSEDQLKRIIAVNRLCPSARNQQVLRFRPVLEDEADKVLPYIRMGAALPHLHLPEKGSEPMAFIVVCAQTEPDKYVYTDLGISLQSMLLQAVEIGLNGICIGAFDAAALRESLNLPYEPLMVLAVGRGKEDICLVDISQEQNHSYYRDEQGVHYVPKLHLDELIIK